MNSEQNTARTRRLAFLIPLAGFVVLAGFASLALLATLRGERDMTQLPSAMVGKPAPAVALPDLRDAGGTVSAIGFKGRPFLVNVFASWCAPCRAEAPALALLSEEIEIFGIAYKDKSEDTRGFLATYGDPFAGIGIDRDGDAGMRWGVYGVPETFVVGADGTIAYKHIGPVTQSDLDRKILPLVRELQAAAKEKRNPG